MLTLMILKYLCKPSESPVLHPLPLGHRRLKFSVTDPALQGALTD